MNKYLSPNRKYKKDFHLKEAKISQFIYQRGEVDFLAKISKEVININSKTTQSKIKYLKECLLKYRKITGLGRGIAAPQVGIPEKIAVIYTPKKLITIINPKVTKYSDKKLKVIEGCMSATPILANVIRPAWIEFEYFDEFGNKKYFKTKAQTKLGKILNRVFQHEIDHLEGIINIDRVESSKDLIFLSDPLTIKNILFLEV